jgi:glycosyltransferase involved in cell wall biosynthesis
MKVAWVSVYDAADPRAYQGRGYYAPLSLKDQSISVEYIGPLQISTISRLRRKLLDTKHRSLHDNRFIHRNNSRWYSRENVPFVFKDYARQISSQLAKLRNVDIVCSGVNPCVQPIAYLECEQPIVIWTDTTFASAIDFYPRYFRNNICEESVRDITDNERSALSRCSLAIFASEWGARSAIDHYQLDPSKVKVVPFGANIECRRNLENIKKTLDARPSDRCKLLFVGVDWIRKGGDIALGVAEELNRAGLPTELTVVGCQPVVSGSLPSFVHPLGYISNATREGQERLSRLFSESHLFIMPSRAESFGHVFCEASSFGVPSLATNVGGIPTAVRNDVNGRTFPRDASIKEYCIYISNLFSNYSRYKDLSLSSFNEYNLRLNWSVAGRTVKELLMNLIP